MRHTLTAFALAAVLAAGCGPSPGDVTAARGPTPVARLAHLEAELSALKAEQAKLSADAAAVAASLKAEQARAAGLVKERDGLRAEAAAGRRERDAARADHAAAGRDRDAARAKLDGFRRELRQLLDRVDASPSFDPAAFGRVGF